MKESVAYSVPIPLVPNNSFNFTFTVTLPDGIHGLTFNWIWYDVNGNVSDSWLFTDTAPDGTIKNGRVSPNAVNFSQSSDYGIFFKTSLQNIGQNDLTKCSMYFLYWI